MCQPGQQSIDKSATDESYNVYDEDLSSSLADEELVPNEVETAPKVHTVPKLIGFGRTFSFASMFLAGILVSVIAYVALNKEAKVAYNVTYSSAVGTLQDSSDAALASLLDSVKTLADSLVRTAELAPVGFPFVTLSTFDLQASLARSSIHSPLAFWSPLLTTSRQMETWGAYTTTKVDQLYGDNSTQVTTQVFPKPTNLPVAPIWQVNPIKEQLVNFNVYSIKGMEQVGLAVSAEKVPLFTETIHLSSFKALDLSDEITVTKNKTTVPPVSLLVYPIMDKYQDVTGLIQVSVPWASLLQEPLPGLVVVLSNSCGERYTYELQANGTATFIGPGDLHNKGHDASQVIIPLASPDTVSVDSTSDLPYCQYYFAVYASDEFQNVNLSTLPYTVTFGIAFIFVLFMLGFFVYDQFVQRFNADINDNAIKADLILSSLFPSAVKDRLMQSPMPKGNNFLIGLGGNDETKNLTGFFAAQAGSELDFSGKPIADLFPETTVMFADIAGFTAWSSSREPTQVFTLLETVFHAFDEAAKRRRVYKVETVGDCYVAVCGLPDPRPDHALAMCRFARDCLISFQKLSKKLEVKLGPDTGDLAMRIGIHSGQVTGGVLRGERSRFQLFGDTMNTAARMESTGIRGKVQLSQDTADLVLASGKHQWVALRENMVNAKGKGEMQTYWLNVGSGSNGGTTIGGSISCDNSVNGSDASESGIIDRKALSMVSTKTARLIEWNCDVLLRLLKQVVVRREVLKRRNPNRKADADEGKLETGNHLVIEEVKEIINLPPQTFGDLLKDSDAYVLPREVVEQLVDYVSSIAAMYQEHPFHNFEHASHVTMSVTKLLSRIVAPTHLQTKEGETQALHDHTYGITSDPLTQFACVISALIHDADHPGVPNAQLVKEKTVLAEFYKNQSIAEQHSVDLAWNLLLDDRFAALRRCIYTTEAGLERFRSLVVNSVMATDIMDKDLKTLRNNRWAKAFSEDTVDDDPRDTVNRKATIVIEHLIQASDVAHTMQHWHIYRRWNERFYEECYKAFVEGRAENDPTDSWYKGEMGFYDFYIIPLAKKLKDCGIFGVSSDEYLNYAQRNRKEWEERGEEVVQEMSERIKAKYSRK